MFNPMMEPVSPENHHDIRPNCPCCGGGEKRKGYSYSKAKSFKLSEKARRDKGKDSRNRRSVRLEKMSLEFR